MLNISVRKSATRIEAFIALFLIGIVLVLVSAFIHGIILAFSASILLGILCLFLEIPFPVFGIAYWVTGVDLAANIVQTFPTVFTV
jgi:hypothetical protein